MKNIFVHLFLFIPFITAAQDSSSTGQVTRPFSISGYLEAYYSYDFNKPANNTRPGFLYNFNRHNEFTLNLGFIKASYLTERTRANLAIGVGTYMNANYAAEPGLLKNIVEANAGYKLSATKNLWFDIGIQPSHIGFEAAVGRDNWTLTRSMVAENTPYFESGAKLSFTTNDEKLIISALVLNGWQRITRLNGNSLLSWGTQLTYKPNEKTTLNYSTFIGTDTPDSARLWRYHNNLYGILQISSKIGLIANIDYGLEQKTPHSSQLNQWYTPVLILRLSPHPHWAAAIRAEYFSDKNGVVIKTGTRNGFKTAGGSVNLDYQPVSAVLFRLEGRFLKSKDAIFVKEGMAQEKNTALSFSTSIRF